MMWEQKVFLTTEILKDWNGDDIRKKVLEYLITHNANIVLLPFKEYLSIARIIAPTPSGFQEEGYPCFYYLGIKFVALPKEEAAKYQVIQ